ncbi:hypothetical protein GA0070616_1350 [Micromonospora nigra]|uniref:Uncharacterized protein n=1 Tax=Micromonospora nigra TaxID=145857 RepID=A0A1C6RKQ9_9ACTN|nr:hypothetical protein GA0070616_1350 [Micromonospora nigra]
MNLTPQQVQNRLVIAAKVIITDHWPRPNRRDWCPICHCQWMCQATTTAYGYLRSVGRSRYVPPHVPELPPTLPPQGTP